MRRAARHLQVVAWMLTTVVLALAFVAWVQGFNWNFDQLSIYTIFPIFGLVAFSTMWSQYVLGGLQHALRVPSSELRTYFKISGFIVLAAILIHPSLLTWQLWRDGQGLPPGSDLRYVMPSLHVAVVIGMTCLLIFLAFELRRVFANHSWWKYMNILVDVAVLAIFYHGLRLGAQTQHGWFQKLWWFYGISLILILANKYVSKISAQITSKQSTKQEN